MSVSAISLDLRLFGSPRLCTADGTALALGRRARALVAYLYFAQGQRATRERLIGLLWGDRGETQARASLRQCLLDTRQALPPGSTDLLIADRETIALNPRAVSSDLERIEQAATAAAPAELTAALIGIHGEPLVDALEIGESYSEWLAGLRGTVEARLVTMVATEIARLAAIGDWATLRPLADAWLTRDPLDERIVATAITADLALQSPAVAHRRFRALAAALERDGLGAPGPAVQAALQAGAPGLSIPPIAAPPPAAASMPTIVGGLASARAADPPLVRIARFTDAEVAGRHPYLAGGLREEIVSGLSRFRDLRLVIDNSATPAADAAPDAYGLHATLRRRGDAIVVMVQLLSLGGGRVVWSDRLDLPERELQAAVDSIVARIVAAVLPAVDADLVLSAPPRPKGDLYSRYLMARHAARRPSSHGVARLAAAELEAVVAADPGFAFAYLPLARLYNTDFAYTEARSSGPAERDRAFELSRAALELDRGHVHAYTVTGWCHLWRGNRAAAQQYFDRALALNPYHGERLLEVAYGRIFLGGLDDAAELCDRYLELTADPNDNYYGEVGLIELLRGDHVRARGHFEMIARPDIWMDLFAAASAALAGDDVAPVERARAHLQRLWPGNAVPPLAALIDWVNYHQPYADGRHRARLIDGIEAAFG